MVGSSQDVRGTQRRDPESEKKKGVSETQTVKLRQKGRGAPPPPQDPSPLRGTPGSSLRSPAEGEVELRRGSQPSPWVGPGKPNLPLGLRGKAGGGLCPGLEARFPARRREERRCGPVTGKDRASCQSGGAPALRPGSRGERSPWLPLETRPDSPGEPGALLKF